MRKGGILSRKDDDQIILRKENIEQRIVGKVSTVKTVEQEARLEVVSIKVEGGESCL